MSSFKKLDAHLDKYTELGIPSFHIEVKYKGETVYTRFHGYSDYEKKVPMNGSELYNIYSCSKPLTCTAAMTLFDKGKFKLEDKLCDYLPEFTNMKVKTANGLVDAERPIRIIDLFTMSAGLTYDLRTENLVQGMEETDGAPTVEMMKYLARDPLAFHPAEKFSYSLCHDVIAALVEVISQERFGEYIKREVFDKAGMEETTFLPTEETSKRLCAQYRFENGQYTPIGDVCVYRFGKNFESGGAGAISSLNDYLKFLEAFRKGELLSDNARKLMITNRLRMDQMDDYGLKDIGYGYGLGVRCPLTPESKSNGIGWGGAAGAYLCCDIVNEISFYHAQHVLCSPNQSMRNDLYFIIKEELGIDLPQNEKAENGDKVTY